jgi:hypothetical protein
MKPIQHIRRFAGVLAGLAAALVAFGATPAFATPPPPEPAPASHPALSPWQLVGGTPFRAVSGPTRSSFQVVSRSTRSSAVACPAGRSP